MREVMAKTTASTSNTVPKVPPIMLKANKKAITTAIINLIILSALPIFDVIVYFFSKVSGGQEAGAD